jgi:hypothetical protein
VKIRLASPQTWARATGIDGMRLTMPCAAQVAAGTVAAGSPSPAYRLASSVSRLYHPGRVEDWSP